jgi:dCMP deaminase
MKDTRPSWDNYFLKIALLTSERSNCIKRKVGAIIVKDNRILSLGYNGTPFGMKNCFDGGCTRCIDQWNKKENNSGTNLDLCMCLHAEDNALLFVSQNDIKNATIYITLFPCITCLKKILQCKIKRIVYIEDYNTEIQKMTFSLIEDANIKIEKITLH